MSLVVPYPHKCAWCEREGRVTWTDGRGLTVAAPVPAIPPALVSHGMCLGCAEKFFPEPTGAKNADDQRPAEGFLVRDGAVVARESHKLEVAGSIPAPATKFGLEVLS